MFRLETRRALILRDVFEPSDRFIVGPIHCRAMTTPLFLSAESEMPRRRSGQQQFVKACRILK
jgi:hypothetical protein